MGRMYTVEFENVAVSASQDFFEITPADDRPCLVHAIFIGQSSDMGDSEEEGLRIKIIRGHTTSGSGGTAPTPIKRDERDAAAGFTCKVNNTTIASAGTPVDVHSEPFNSRVGFQYVPTPAMWPRVDQGQTTLVVRLMNAPADALTMSGTMYVEEL